MTCHTLRLAHYILLLNPFTLYLTPYTSHRQADAVVETRSASTGNAGEYIGHAPHFTRHTSRVACHSSHVTRHTSRVTRHASHVTRHTSRVTRRTSRISRLALQALRKDPKAAAEAALRGLQGDAAAAAAAAAGGTVEVDTLNTWGLGLVEYQWIKCKTQLPPRMTQGVTCDV